MAESVQYRHLIIAKVKQQMGNVRAKRFVGRFVFFFFLGSYNSILRLSSIRFVVVVVVGFYIYCLLR